MRADGLTPNTVSYNIVIDAYAKVRYCLRFHCVI